MSTQTRGLVRVLEEEIASFLWKGEHDIAPQYLETPFDLQDKLLACPHAKQEFFLQGTPPQAEQNGEKRVDRRGPANHAGLLRRILGGIRGRNGKRRPLPAVKIGARYTLSRFPVFEALFPDPGLSVGEGDGRHWIRPVRIETRMQDLCAISKGDQVVCTFHLQFKKGLGGEAGYMDRIGSQGRFSRWHIYPSGDITTADLYEAHRLRHDIFRTIMGKILLGEIYPECYSTADMVL